MNAEAERYHVRQAVRIIRQFIENERAMRERVSFTWLVERLYTARPDLRPEPEPQAEQPPLLEVR